MVDHLTSIIIPCYNAEGTIRETLQSALSQGSHIEIIAVDDGSTDDTSKILRSYNSRITVLSQPNLGVSAARNAGIGRASGDWFQFLDADDLLLPNTIQTRVSEGAGFDVVICDWYEFTSRNGAQTVGARRGVDPSTLAADAEVAIAGGLWAPPAAVLFRREMVDRVGPFRPDLLVVQDVRFLFDAACNNARFKHLPVTGAAYRVTKTSLSRRDPGSFWSDVLVNAEQIEALWKSRGPLYDSQSKTLSEVFNLAMRELFQSGNPKWRAALEAAYRTGLPPRRFTLSTQLLMKLAGEPLTRAMTKIAVGHREQTWPPCGPSMTGTLSGFTLRLRRAICRRAADLVLSSDVVRAWAAQP
jgi:glycosyltransferase involved in cell wall biosynthesis